MNIEYLEKAKKLFADPRELIVLASKRAKQLAHGARPLVKCDSDNFLDAALLEIAEQKLIIGEGKASDEE
jgi:DNA-directed RNA polymerase subunit K/omega